jgi:hypothetical protein
MGQAQRFAQDIGLQGRGRSSAVSRHFLKQRDVRLVMTHHLDNA